MPDTLDKISLIFGAALPYVMSLSMRQSIEILSFIKIFVWKILFPIAVFKEIFKTTLVPLSATAFVDSFAFNYSVLPLAHVVVTVRRRPQTNSVLFAVFPFTRIELSLVPLKLSFAFFFAIYKGTPVCSY